MLKSINEIPQPTPDTLLTRALSIANFQRLLADRTVFFSRLDSFDDQSEFAINRDSMVGYIYPPGGWSWWAYTKALPNLGRMSFQDWANREIDLTFAKLQLLKSRIFVSCWTVADNIGERMWIGKEPGAAVRIRAGSLLGQIGRPSCATTGLVSYGPIEKFYQPLAQGISSYIIFSLMCKRLFYSFEQEFRLVIAPSNIDPTTTLKEEADKTFGQNQQFTMDLSIIEEILLFGSPEDNVQTREMIQKADLSCRVTELPWMPFAGTPFRLY